MEELEVIILLIAKISYILPYFYKFLENKQINDITWIKLLSEKEDLVC